MNEELEVKEELSEDGEFATELLHEVRTQTKRWFIAFIIMVIVEISTIGVFMWYISLPIDDVSIENETGNANFVGNDLNGAIYNGKDTSEETGDKKRKAATQTAKRTVRHKTTNKGKKS